MITVGKAAACSVFALSRLDEILADGCLVVAMDSSDLSHSWERFRHRIIDTSLLVFSMSECAGISEGTSFCFHPMAA